MRRRRTRIRCTVSKLAVPSQLHRGLREGTVCPSATRLRSALPRYSSGRAKSAKAKPRTESAETAHDQSKGMLTLVQGADPGPGCPIGWNASHQFTILSSRVISPLGPPRLVRVCYSDFRGNLEHLKRDTWSLTRLQDELARVDGLLATRHRSHRSNP